MQDSELAFLHRSLTKPAEVGTNHPDFTQANHPALPKTHLCFQRPAVTSKTYCLHMRSCHSNNLQSKQESM